MVNFLKKRLQVFVSSTYIDLRDERQAAVEAILRAGHIPAGMELFTAGNESQMEVIKQWIDESDVYLLILGGRYGSIEPKSGKSYIHLEYEYALEKGIPLFSCVLENPDERATNLGKIDYIERDNLQKYKDFKNLVKSKLVTFWSDTKDIKLSIIQTLQDFARNDNLVGWVRGNEQINLAPVTEEIARLSEENNSLRQRLNQSKEQSFVGLSYEEMKSILEDVDLEQLKNSCKELNLSLIDDDSILIKIINKILNDSAMYSLLDLFKFARKNLANSSGILLFPRSLEQLKIYELVESFEELVIHGLVGRIASSRGGHTYIITSSGKRIFK